MAEASLARAIDRIINHDPEELIVAGKGTQGFKDLAGLLRTAQGIAKLCKSLALDDIPAATRSSLRGPVAEYAGKLDAIASFDTTHHLEGGQDRDALVKSTETTFHKAYEALASHILILTIGTDDFKDRFAHMGNTLDRFSVLATRCGKEIEAHKVRIEQLVSSTEEQVKKLAVAKFEKHYGELADEHRRSSTYWLIAAALSAVCAGAFSILSLKWELFKLTGNLTDAGSIQQIVARIVVISLLYFAVVWCAKNYRSNRHLYVTNKHRQTALNTFDTLTKAFSEDDSAKNAVLLEAARCMFAPSVSGFLGPEENVPNPMGEIINRVSGGST